MSTFNDVIHIKMLSVAVSLRPPVSVTVTVHVTDVDTNPESVKGMFIY